MADTRSFPDGFLWGTATAAHQIEGGNTNNDWWAWEHRPDSICAEPSGDACDSFNRWREDLAIVASLGLGAYRFSLEWSRIEPAQGEFSEVALRHYRQQLEAALAMGIEPVVTFHHFTTPSWLAAQGGFEHPDAPALFAEFCARATERLGDVLSMACTINEPNVVALAGYRMGAFPPGVADRGRYEVVTERFCEAHRLAQSAIKAGPGSFPVGMTLSMTEFVAAPGGEARLASIRALHEDVYLDATRGDDFLGVQCYSREVVDAKGLVKPTAEQRTTQMGYEFWPGCVEHTVKRAAAWTQNPIYVTENGIGTEDDGERIEYLTEAISGAHQCIVDGVDLRGYFCWSLLDNFEWVYGYRPKFGLVEVNRSTLKRTPKASAQFFASVAKANALSR